MFFKIADAFRRGMILIFPMFFSRWFIATGWILTACYAWFSGMFDSIINLIIEKIPTILGVSPSLFNLKDYLEKAQYFVPLKEYMLATNALWLFRVHVWCFSYIKSFIPGLGR